MYTYRRFVFVAGLALFAAKSAWSAVIVGVAICSTNVFNCPQANQTALTGTAANIPAGGAVLFDARISETALNPIGSSVTFRVSVPKPWEFVQFTDNNNKVTLAVALGAYQNNEFSNPDKFQVEVFNFTGVGHYPASLTFTTTDLLAGDPAPFFETINSDSTNKDLTHPGNNDFAFTGFNVKITRKAASGNPPQSQIDQFLLKFTDVNTVRGSVPEPASLALVGLGLAGLAFSRRSKV